MRAYTVGRTGAGSLNSNFLTSISRRPNFSPRQIHFCISASTRHSNHRPGGIWQQRYFEIESWCIEVEHNFNPTTTRGEWTVYFLDKNADTLIVIGRKSERELRSILGAWRRCAERRSAFRRILRLVYFFCSIDHWASQPFCVRGCCISYLQWKSN